MRRSAVVLVVGLAFLPLAGRAALHDRGRGLIYDDVLNVTWMQDANLAAEQTFGVGGIAADGTMLLTTANAWIAAMNGADYKGFSDWRLPTARPVAGSTIPINPPSNDGSTDGGFGYTGTNSELAHLYYTSLGNLGEWVPKGGGSSFSHDIQDGFGLVNVGPFINLGPVAYHVVALAPIEATYDQVFFNFINGLQDGSFFISAHAWAVRTGDVAAVPEPSSWGFLVAGLAAMASAFTRNKHDRRC